MAEIIITGLQELLESMERLPHVLQKKLITDSLRQGAVPVQKEIQSRAPDDPDTPGNRIADNIGVKMTEATSNGGLALIGPTKKGFVAGFHERGTKYMSARPFIGPAFDRTVDEAVGIIGEVLGSGIAKALKE